MRNTKNSTVVKMVMGRGGGSTEHHALVAGLTGSGKSTIAKCINGLIPSTYAGKLEGEISVCGENPAKAGIFGISKHVGTVLQDTDGQFIGLTVAEDIAFALENDNVPAKEMH